MQVAKPSIVGLDLHLVGLLGGVGVGQLLAQWGKVLGCRAVGARGARGLENDLVVS